MEILRISFGLKVPWKNYWDRKDAMNPEDLGICGQAF